MRKSHFRIRFRVNRAAHKKAYTALFILMFDPPDPVQTLEFRNDTPQGLPWDFEFRTFRPLAEVKVDILSDRKTLAGDPTIWIEAEWNGGKRECRVCADKEGHIRHREVFAATDTPPQERRPGQ